MDLWKGYYKVRIVEGNEPKTTWMTMYGSFEFLVMPFGMCNAPAMFCTIINDALWLFLEKFVVLYLDDIVIFRKTMEEHKTHLAEVFKVLRENKLYLKWSKCIFAKSEIPFLGHWVGQGCTRMDSRKVEAIIDWEEPTMVQEVQSFLRLENCYLQFMEGYSKIVALLTNLLKKNKHWNWMNKCWEEFYEL